MVLGIACIVGVVVNKASPSIVVTRVQTPDLAYRFRFMPKMEVL